MSALHLIFGWTLRWIQTSTMKHTYMANLAQHQFAHKLKERGKHLHYNNISLTSRCSDKNTSRDPTACSAKTWHIRHFQQRFNSGNFQNKFFCCTISFSTDICSILVQPSYAYATFFHYGCDYKLCKYHSHVAVMFLFIYVNFVFTLCYGCVWLQVTLQL